MQDQQISFQIWDIAGQNLFNKIRKTYYQRASGSLLLFDLTDKKSFRSIPGWIQEFIAANNDQLTPLIIIGNKVDLVEDKRIIDPDKANEKIRDLIDWTNSVDPNSKVTYIKTSALNDVNVRLAFGILRKFMLHHKIADKNYH